MNVDRRQLTIAVFMLVLWLPLMGMIMGVGILPPLLEQRVLAEAPRWADTAGQPPAARPQVYARAGARYIDDHFGFRQELQRANGLLLIAGWPAHKSVAVGHDGWLFYADPAALHSYRPTTLMTTAVLDRWTATLQARHAWLADQGIEYLLVIAPEKSTIYPEAMPPQAGLPAIQTRTDQLTAHLAAHSNVQVLDLRPVLAAEKTRRQAYFPSDSHWNPFGAFAAYSAIVARLRQWFPSLHPLPESDFQQETHLQMGGDLAHLLGVPELYTHPFEKLVPAAGWAFHAVESDLPVAPGVPVDHQPRLAEIDDDALPRTVIFHDSFGNAPAPFLAQHFRRTLFLQQYSLDQNVILREQPDVVVQIMVERMLDADAPPESRILIDEPIRPPADR